MKILPVLILPFLLSSCAYPRITVKTADGHCVTYTAPRLGGDVRIGEIDLQIDGVSAKVTAYESETIQAFKEGAKLAAGLAKP